MASIRRLKRTGASNYSYVVRYRDPQRVERSKTFRKKVDAQAFAAAVESDIDRGIYLDPHLGRKTLESWADEWLQARRNEIKPTTLMSYQGLLRAHILPALGRTPMARIRPLDIQRFLGSMADRGLSRSRIRQSRQLLSMILNAAADNGYIGRNPVPRERLGGKEARRDQHPLTFEQVHSVASAVPPRYKALIYVLAYGGLRWGEAAALRRLSCNLLRNRLEVREAVSEVAGGLHYGTPKTHQARTVLLPEPVKEILAAHLADYVPLEPNSLVFTTDDGTHIWITNFRKNVWRPALDACGIPDVVAIKDLRHTCASLMHAAGRSPKEIKEQLGHSTIAMTMDTYTHLFESGREEAAEAMAAAFRSSLKK